MEQKEQKAHNKSGDMVEVAIVSEQKKCIQYGKLLGICKVLGQFGQTLVLLAGNRGPVFAAPMPAVCQ
jgi:hypothetical protein